MGFTITANQGIEGQNSGTVRFRLRQNASLLGAFTLAGCDDDCCTAAWVNVWHVVDVSQIDGEFWILISAAQLDSARFKTSLERIKEKRLLTLINACDGNRCGAAGQNSRNPCVARSEVRICRFLWITFEKKGIFLIVLLLPIDRPS